MDIEIIDRLAIRRHVQNQAVEVGIFRVGEGVSRKILAEHVDQVRLDQHCPQHAVFGLNAVQLHDAHACSSRWRNTARLQITSRRGTTIAPR